jgi:hypothetical protein
MVTSRIPKDKIAGFRESYRNYPSSYFTGVDDDGRGFLTNAVTMARPCGCAVVGNGTLQLPLEVEPCALHSSPAPHTFNVTQPVTYQQAADALCCALEGGSNYWYQIIKANKPPSFLDVNFREGAMRTLKTSESIFLSDAAHSQAMGKEPTVYPHLDYPFNEGGSLVIEAIGDHGEGRDTINGLTSFTLNLETIAKGLQTLADKYNWHFAALLSESNCDAETGDAFLQCCLFGEIVYG